MFWIYKVIKEIIKPAVCLRRKFTFNSFYLI